MDRAIAISVLLLVGLTWLLYQLTVVLDPNAQKNVNPTPRPEAVKGGAAHGVRETAQKPVHQRLRK